MSKGLHPAYKTLIKGAVGAILKTSIVVEFLWKPENRLLLATIHTDTGNRFINSLVAFGALLILNYASRFL